MLEVFFFFLCIIHLNYNTVNKLNVFRLKFPLILQLSDTVTVLRNIDTHTHTLLFCVRFIPQRRLWWRLR